MQIRILVTASYTDFDSDPPGRAITLQAGDVVERPVWYARGLIAAGLAQALEEIPPAEPPVAPVEFDASEYKPRGRPRKVMG